MMKNALNRLLKRVHQFATFWMFQLRSTDRAFMILIPIAIGILGGLGAAVLRFLIHLFEGLFWGNWGESFGWIRTLTVPTATAFIVGLIIYHFSREAKGHGVPEVMQAIALKNGVIRPRVVFSKTIASSLTIASGGSVGREGPIIQIGAAIGSSLGQLFNLPGKRLQTLVGCGAAAGIAAAFNAPIAGAMFAVEIILGDFAVSRFSPIVISSVSATVVSRFFYGDTPSFLVPKYNLVHWVELIPYAVLGLICGLVAILFVKALYFCEDRFDSLAVADYLKTTLGGLLLGGLGLVSMRIFGVGYETINSALHGTLPLGWLVILVFMKIAATSLTLGSGNSGGIFAPSLFMGAMTGGAFGTLLHQLLPHHTADSGAYALVAMSAVVGASTQAPITAIMIIFEMTSDYKIILPLMIATIISSLMTSKIEKGSIYTLKLIRKGINIHQGKEINILKSMQVGDYMRRSIATVSPDRTLEELCRTFLGSPHSFLFVKNRDSSAISGFISQNELSAIAPDYENLKNIAVAVDIARENPFIVSETDHLDFVMKLFEKENIGEIPVRNPETGEITGTIWRIDVIAAYNKEIIKRDLTSEVSHLMKVSSRKEYIEIADNIFLHEVDPPAAFFGQRIADLNIRNRYHVEIVLIKGKDPLTRLPDREYRFTPGESLLLMGERRYIEQFETLR